MPARFCLLFLFACSSPADAPIPTNIDERVVTVEPTERSTDDQASTADQADSTEQFVTVAEITSPDGSRVLGVALAMRSVPRADASDYGLPDSDIDQGDARAVLFGAEMVRGDDGEVLSARTGEREQRFELSRTALTAPVRVWRFDDDAILIEAIEVTPCDRCEPWTSPPARFIVVVPAQANLAAAPEPGWNIAISP